MFEKLTKCDMIGECIRFFHHFFVVYSLNFLLLCLCDRKAQLEIGPLVRNFEKFCQENCTQELQMEMSRLTLVKTWSQD